MRVLGLEAQTAAGDTVTTASCCFVPTTAILIMWGSGAGKLIKHIYIYIFPSSESDADLILVANAHGKLKSTSGACLRNMSSPSRTRFLKLESKSYGLEMSPRRVC